MQYFNLTFINVKSFHFHENGRSPTPLETGNLEILYKWNNLQAKKGDNSGQRTRGCYGETRKK